jgi:hypothetical protein
MIQLFPDLLMWRPSPIHEAEGVLVRDPFYVGAVAAAGFVLGYGGSLAAEIDGALLAGTAGGLIGFLFRRRHQREQLDHGGLLLWVRTLDVWHISVPSRYSSGRDVHVHAFPTGA